MMCLRKALAMFDAGKVQEHFLQFTGLTQEQGSEWSGLCGEAIIKLAKRIRKGVDPDSEVDRGRLEQAAGACACYAWRLLQRDGEITEERLGDIQVKYERSARDLEDYFLSQVSDLLAPDTKPLIRVEP